VGSRSGPMPWLALGSSVLIILVVVLLGTHMITPAGEPTDFDSVTRRMGMDCHGLLMVPPALSGELDAASFPCQTPSGDLVMLLVAYVPGDPGTVVSSAPTLSPEIVRWVCSQIGGGFLYGASDTVTSWRPAAAGGVAVRPTDHDSQAHELTDAVGLYPASFSC
jgi:hypothetical protein